MAPRRTTTRRRPPTRPRPLRASAAPSRDLTHIFIAAPRMPRHPGPLCRRLLSQRRRAWPHDGGHAWARPRCPISAGSAFDPANGFCPTDASCPRRRRARRARRRAGARHALRSRRRDARGGDQGRSIDASSSATPADRNGINARAGSFDSMTYCCGILVREGLVMFARHADQCRRRQHLDLPQAARVQGPEKADHGDRFGRQSVDQPIGGQHPDRGLREPGNRRTRDADERADHVPGGAARRPRRSA